MELIIENNIIYNIEETETKKIKIYYDVFYHYSITLDKTSILANGIDTLTATIEKKNYLKERQIVDELITLEIEGQWVEVELYQGVGQITITSESVGVKTIKTMEEGVRNGEIKFTAN